MRRRCDCAHELGDAALYELRAQGAGRLDILAHARTFQVGQASDSFACVYLKPPSGAKTDAKSGKRAPRPPAVDGRLCAIRKSEAAAAKARDRVRRESQRNGTVLQPQTLEAAAYVFIFTTLPKQVSAAQVLEIYRLRWQIELEFKRLKSLIALGHLKKHDPQAARSWMQGKLVVALLIARLIAHAERVSPWGYEISTLGPRSPAVLVA